MFAVSSLRISLVVFVVAACHRAPTPTPTARPPAASRDAAAPVAPREPSADAVVLSPGEGIGPFSLGMSRAAVQARGAMSRAETSHSVRVDAFEVSFDEDAPAGVATLIRVMLADAAAGVRVGTAVLPTAATYEQVIAAVGPCGARVLRRGGITTPCQGGAVKVVQVSNGAVGLEVSR